MARFTVAGLVALIGSSATAFENNLTEGEIAKLLDQAQFSELVVGDKAYASIADLCWAGNDLMLDIASSIEVISGNDALSYDFNIQVERVPGNSFVASTLKRGEAPTSYVVPEVFLGGIARNLLIAQPCADRAQKYADATFVNIVSIDGFSNILDLMKSLKANLGSGKQ